MSTNDELKNENANGTKPVLAADADYWLTAPKEEVKKFIEENTDIEEYEIKKKEILCKIQNKAKHLEQ